MQEVLRKLLQRLTRLAKTAEDFRALTSPGWAPRIGAYMCAAHWLSHSLQEAAGPLLLLDLEGDRSFWQRFVLLALPACHSSQGFGG